MKDQGFSGSGSRFVPRFKAGSPIYADQLNDLATGLGVTLSQPYIGSGPSVSFTGGGSIITNPDNSDLTLGLALQLIDGNEYVNHYEIASYYIHGVGALLKVAKGGNVWRPENTACAMEKRADVLMTDGTIAVVTGANPLSPWASNDGYIVMTPGTVYYVYAFKLETEFATAFYIYISTNGTLVDSCPVPMPGGFSPPGIPYDFQGVLVGTAVVAAPLVPVPFAPVIDQKVVGSITWPNLPPPTVTEYVNHWEAKYEVIQVEGVDTDIVRVGRGGNVWNPSTSTDGNAHEKRADVIVSDGTVSVVTGTDTNSPWASDNGYILPYGGVNTYIYAFKVTYDNGNTSDFHIYAATSDTLLPAAGGEVALPAGLLPAPAPAGQYTVQGLRVADIIWNGATEAPHFYINQRVVGSITWPDYVPPYRPLSFEVKVTQDIDIFKLQVAKGHVYGRFGGSSYYESSGDNFAQYDIKGFAIYPTGALTTGSNPESPWASDGGYVSLDVATEYRVYIVQNNNSGSDFAPWLAVLAKDSDGDNKSRSNLGLGLDAQPWCQGVTESTVTVNDYPNPSFNITISAQYPSGIPFQYLKARRVLIAKLKWNTETGVWDVEQDAIGDIELEQSITFGTTLVWNTDVSTTPPWAGWPLNIAANMDWDGDWSGSDKSLTSSETSLITY
jgi:hypothetical protein